jgi:hypothetical protein
MAWSANAEQEIVHLKAKTGHRRPVFVCLRAVQF